MFERHVLTSSHLDATSYDASNGTLRIEFKDGSEYEYNEVPQYIFDDFLAADSQGKYAHKNIFGKYGDHKIR